MYIYIIYLCKIQQRKILCNHSTRTGSHVAYHLSHISSQQHSWSCDNRNQRDVGKTFHAQASLWPPRTGLQYKTWSNKYVIIYVSTCANSKSLQNFGKFELYWFTKILLISQLYFALNSRSRTLSHMVFPIILTLSLHIKIYGY